LAPKPGNSAPGTLPAHPEKPAASAQLAQVRDLMWRHVGILRSGKELSAAIALLEKMELHGVATSERRLSASTVDARGHTGAPGLSGVVATAEQDHLTRADFELRNLHTLATLIARSALAREESRGSHYRSDFPYRDDDLFQKHSLIQRFKDVTFEV
jgi:L-aspartate oxidase